jgi:hypothetical protein
VEQIDLRYPLLGAIVGTIIGAVYHYLRRAPREETAGPPDPARVARIAEQQRQVVSFLERAARTMVTYSHMVDAANAGNGAELSRLFSAMKAEEAATTLAELKVDDRGVRDAARNFVKLHREIEGKVEQRLAAGQTVQIGGELRVRAEELGKRVSELQAAAGAFANRKG